MDLSKLQVMQKIRHLALLTETNRCPGHDLKPPIVPIAQLVEQQTFNLRVDGSKPSGDTINSIMEE